MRKAQQEEIIQFIGDISKVHQKILNTVSNSTEEAQKMLVKCQEYAISLGNVIEKFEGENFITVSYLEEYCDIVFHIYQDLNTSEYSANRIYKLLNKHLLKIENSVKNDIHIKKEIAFFPYKASMWDSLESVYLAAKEDPDCDVYCVPIPYFDLKPDRTFGEMHYEGHQYPKSIECTNYQTYKYEERKPDIIYIHNPYDEWNLVTSVHPRFYSSRLKNYTNELVYIPYFVLQEINPTNQKVIDSIKHFIWTPGVIYADKVIVQSENMRQIYIQEYLKEAMNNGIPADRRQLERKILGLGSPKFVKIAKLKNENISIPNEWLTRIRKPDGTFKKIVLYNTSITALLENNEKMLAKIRNVLNIFYCNRDKATLLWRPHPLISTTMKAMRPQLWDEYNSIVNEYREAGWGIYDDSSDMNRAVAISDAYYGDCSSVVYLCQNVEMPIMVQNPNIIELTNG